MTLDQIESVQDSIALANERRLDDIVKANAAYKATVNSIQESCPHDFSEVSGTENHSHALRCTACGKVTKL